MGRLKFCFQALISSKSLKSWTLKLELENPHGFVFSAILEISIDLNRARTPCLETDISVFFSFKNNFYSKLIQETNNEIVIIVKNFQYLKLMNNWNYSAPILSFWIWGQSLIDVEGRKKPIQGDVVRYQAILSASSVIKHLWLVLEREGSWKGSNGIQHS